MSKARCSAPECGRDAAARGLCPKHYAADRLDRLRAQVCTVSGCGRSQVCSGLCRGHYSRQRRGASIEEPLRTQQRGTVVLTCRVSRRVLEALRERAARERETPNRLAARLLRTGLGITD